MADKTIINRDPEASDPGGRLAHSPRSAAHALSISERAVFELIAADELLSFKSGKRRLIPDSELRRFVDRKMSQAAAA